MLIVNDIMDAFTMRRKLSSMVRRTLRKQNGALPERIDSEIYASWKESGVVS